VVPFRRVLVPFFFAATTESVRVENGGKKCPTASASPRLLGMPDPKLWEMLSWIIFPVCFDEIGSPKFCFLVSYDLRRSEHARI
jgi:hypothetical protein